MYGAAGPTKGRRIFFFFLFDSPPTSGCRYRHSYLSASAGGPDDKWTCVQGLWGSPTDRRARIFNGGSASRARAGAREVCPRPRGYPGHHHRDWSNPPRLVASGACRILQSVTPKKNGPGKRCRSQAQVGGPTETMRFWGPDSAESAGDMGPSLPQKSRRPLEAARGFSLRVSSSPLTLPSNPSITTSPANTLRGPGVW